MMLGGDAVSLFGVCGSMWWGSHNDVLPEIPRAPTYQGFSMCYALAHLLLTAPFTDEEAEAQRRSLPCLRSHGCDRCSCCSSAQCSSVSHFCDGCLG